MNKQIKILQNILERNIPTSLITKLYNMCLQQESGMTIFTEDSNIVGNITTGYTYQEYIDLINQYFPSLNITATGYYIMFEDPIVQQKLITLSNTLSPNSNYDGVVKDIPFINSGNNTKWGFQQIFKNNTSIQTFNEISKFNSYKRTAKEEFYNCSNLRSVDLTNIQYFCDSSFKGCINLEYFNGKDSNSGDLKLPNLASDGLKYIDTFRWISINGSYQGPKIKRILDLGNCNTLGEDWRSNCVFASNKTLEYVEPNVLEKITSIVGAFSDCTNLVIDDLKLPNITYIGESSFQNVQVKKISELNSCNIALRAFKNCTSLTTIDENVFPNIKQLGTETFYGCVNLTINDLNLPNLTAINENTFYNCNIKTISNLGTIKTVNGFNNCKSLLSVTIPSSATGLGQNAFTNCTNLYLQQSDISNIQFFYRNCLRGVNLPSILYLPKVTTSIEYLAFENCAIKCLYLPHLMHTNGPSGTSTPACSENANRGGNSFRCNGHVSILYFKDINKINGDTFGSRMFNDHSTFDIVHYWNASDIPAGYPYCHVVDGVVVNEYPGSMQIPFLPKGTKTEWTNERWANIKYLVINNTTPPEYWHSCWTYDNKVFGGCGLYGKRSGNESFHCLVVPRSSINDYLNWNAFHPDFSSPNISEEDRQNMIAATTFTNVIAIESMGHFATKAEYDIAPALPDGVHNKEEYLIEEYMDLDTPIQWDPIPTWST